MAFVDHVAGAFKEIELKLKKYRPVGSLFTKSGWAFKDGQFREAVIPSRVLERLLKEEKAKLLIHERDWEEIVSHHRGKKKVKVSPEKVEEARRAVEQGRNAQKIIEARYGRGTIEQKKQLLPERKKIGAKLKQAEKEYERLRKAA